MVGGKWPFGARRPFLLASTVAVDDEGSKRGVRDVSKSRPGNDRPVWEGRVPRRIIFQLYANDAKGILDETLIEEVGYAFLARIDSISRATRALYGEPPCAVCGKILVREGHKKDAVLRCEDCNWEMSWADYHKTFRRKQLNVGGMGEFYRDFSKAYPRVKTPREKLILIDQLIHRCHWEIRGGAGRSGAINLIGGRPNEVDAFLNELTYGQSNTPEVAATRIAWAGKMEERKERRVEKREARRKKKAERDRRRELRKKAREAQIKYKASLKPIQAKDQSS